MHIHYIKHTDFGTIGEIENWVSKKGHKLTGTHVYKNEKLPNNTSFDLLIILGGPLNLIKEERDAHLAEEILFTKKVIAENKAVLGICLGAQIISEALDAKLEPSPNKEVGIYPIQVTKEGEQDFIFKNFPKIFDVMHWHKDMPGIPRGSVLLAQSEACPRQAFRYGDRVYGLQFHLEMTSETIKLMTEHAKDYLTPESYVQTVNELLNANLSCINQKLHIVLDQLSKIVKISQKNCHGHLFKSSGLVKDITSMTETDLGPKL